MSRSGALTSIISLACLGMPGGAPGGCPVSSLIDGMNGCRPRACSSARTRTMSCSTWMQWHEPLPPTAVLMYGGNPSPLLPGPPLGGKVGATVQVTAPLAAAASVATWISRYAIRVVLASTSGQ